ncbi:MAG TPA: hypothetical protein VKJ65_11110, partial [Phycisphaerae bacterium]|nr:hypothetical protein [Phycisphaerae bacterium]
MSAEIEAYYVRVRGKINGPFDRTVLERMVQRGQLSRVHEISTDKQSWKLASTIMGLFAAMTRKTADQTGGAAVGIATPDVPDVSMFQCNSCGAAFPKTESFQLGEQQLCTKCYERIAGPAPSEPVAAGGTNWMGILSKARQEQSDPSNPSEASGAESGEWYELADDGRPKTQSEQPLSVGLTALLAKPASGIFEAYQKLGPEKSIAVGLAGTLIFEASLPLCARYSILDVLRFIYFSNGETLNHVPVKSSDMVVTWVKVFALATAPFIVFILAMFTSRSICRPGSRGAGDVLTAG